MKLFIFIYSIEYKIECFFLKNVKLHINQMPLALIFDVETTGLIPKPNESVSEIPYIIQLSFALYDTDSIKLVETYDAYIRIPDKVVLKPIITELTGITRDLLDEEGIPCGVALDAFYDAWKKADILVAHNMGFDSNMIKIELCAHRPQIDDIYEGKKKEYCTMLNGTELCKISRTNSRGPYLKQPKLSELYAHLFGALPNIRLHNSMVDVLVCLRCFLKMKQNIEVADSEFANWFEKLD